MDRPVAHLWMMRALYVLLALVILFFQVLPLSTLPNAWAPPDILLALTFAWAMRRPDYVPMLLVALVMLTMDLLLQRPPGLMAALVVLGSNYLQNAAGSLRDAGFLGEWGTVSVVMVGIAILYRVILTITAVQLAPLGLTMLELILTIAIYPLVVWISQSIFGVRRLAPADANALGGRA